MQKGAGASSHPPRVRWYDARTRTALRRVAAWLNVPWATVANFEHLLAYQLLLPQEPGQVRNRPTTAWEQGLWAAKVGATTVGVGALFAVTGAAECRMTSHMLLHAPLQVIQYLACLNPQPSRGQSASALY